MHWEVSWALAFLCLCQEGHPPDCSALIDASLFPHRPEVSQACPTLGLAVATPEKQVWLPWGTHGVCENESHWKEKPTSPREPESALKKHVSQERFLQ